MEPIVIVQEDDTWTVEHVVRCGRVDQQRPPHAFGQHTGQLRHPVGVLVGERIGAGIAIQGGGAPALAVGQE